MNFCTLFDRAYAPKGMALIESIKRWMPDAKCFVLYLGDDSPQIENVTYLRDIITDELLTAQENRTWKEFSWTLGSWWVWWLLKILDSVIYVDADTFFFNALELPKADIAICPHRWTPRHKDNLIANGIYNVGLVSFRGTRAGKRCATDWKNNCVEWCYAKHDGERFGDQGYLNNWVETYGAFVINHLGINLAPWNQEQYSYCLEDGHLFVDDGKNCDPLIMYHFSEFGTLKHGKPIRTNYPLNPMVEQYIYAGYESEIAKWTFGSGKT